jgi:hypothetical protein
VKARSFDPLLLVAGADVLVQPLQVLTQAAGTN